MGIEENPYYRSNKYLLSLTGLWPYQTKRVKRTFHIVLYLILFSYTVPQSLGIRKSWGDVDAIIECTPSAILTIMCILFTTTFIYKEEKMRQVFLKINHDWKTWASGMELDILKNYASTAKLFTDAYIILASGSIFLYLLLPIFPKFLDLITPLNETRPTHLPLVVDYCINEEKYFYWLYTHCYLTCLVHVLIVVTTDTTFMVIIQHICGVFVIIGSRLNSILEKNSNSQHGETTFQERFDSNNNELQEKIDEEVAFCVKKHREIITFTHDIQTLLSTSFFLVLGLSVILMSVTGVQTVMTIGEPKEALRFAISTFSQIFRLLYLTIPCQRLIDSSSSISNCIYNGNWYQLSAKTQKILLFIMKKSSAPSSFTVGKLYTFSMPNFTAVLQTSMSYFTLLMSVR